MTAPLIFSGMLLLAAGLATAASATTGAALLPPDEALNIVQAVAHRRSVDVDYYAAPGYYLYADKFSFETDRADVKVVEAVLPPGERKHEEFLGKDIVLYRHPVRVLVRISGKDGRYRLIAHGQGCAEIGVCYPPFSKVFELVAEDK